MTVNSHNHMMKALIWRLNAVLAWPVRRHTHVFNNYFHIYGDHEGVRSLCPWLPFEGIHSSTLPLRVPEVYLFTFQADSKPSSPCSSGSCWRWTRENHARRLCSQPWLRMTSIRCQSVLTDYMIWWFSNPAFSYWQFFRLQTSSCSVIFICIYSIIPRHHERH